MSDEMAEAVARIIDPSSWSVMDGYLAQTKRKYAGQNVGWPTEQFQHTESMAKAREIIATLRPAIIAEERTATVAWLRSVGRPDARRDGNWWADAIERGDHEQKGPSRG